MATVWNKKHQCKNEECWRNYQRVQRGQIRKVGNSSELRANGKQSRSKDKVIFWTTEE